METKVLKPIEYFSDRFNSTEQIWLSENEIYNLYESLRSYYSNE